MEQNENKKKTQQEGAAPASITIITVSLVIFICLLLLTLITNLVKLGNLKTKEADLNVRKAELERQIDENTNSIKYLESDDYVERYAREYLDMAGSDEEIFVGK